MPAGPSVNHLVDEWKSIDATPTKTGAVYVCEARDAFGWSRIRGLSLIPLDIAGLKLNVRFDGEIRLE